VSAIQRGDVTRLTGIPGVGKKTAERIVLELKDRLAQMSAAPAITSAGVPIGDRLRDDLLSALQNLGYHRPLAEKAVDATLAKAETPTFEQALRGALRELMR
jgi:Holliday junction DNA helicase RuvA